MTEKDIAKDMYACSKGCCSDCSRNYKHGCAHDLLKDAISVIKMQDDVLQKRLVDLNSLEEKYKSLQSVVQRDFTEEDIINHVNVILEAAMSDDEDQLWSLIHSLQNLLNLFKGSAYKIAFGTFDFTPKIIKR